MEMASAHGLALKLIEMNKLDRINRVECEIMSEEDRLIKSWLIATNKSFSRLDNVNLTRKTLLFVLSQSSLKEFKKKDLLKGVSIYFNKFSDVLKNENIRKPLIDVIVDPWKNTCFSWEELFQKRLTIRDSKVLEYFSWEPEEIVLARVHLFVLQGKDEMALTLAKSSFLFHSRIAKHLLVSPEPQNQNKQSSNQGNSSNKFRKGTASADWYIAILQRKKNLTSIYNELKQLTCHEGVLLIQRARRNKKIRSFAFNIVQIFFMQELIRPSKFCCTKKIFSLWSIMHKEQKSSVDTINVEIRKMMAMYAPSSAHFYVLADALWNQFGSSLISVYVELYVRGLTVDLNHLEASRNEEHQDDIFYLESHISSMFTKLSTLFSDFHEGASRECMFSAFSLRPTKERLYILQSLTHSILSTENEMKLNLSFSHNSTLSQECKCTVKCTGSCKSLKENVLDHPLLKKGIPKVPFCVVKDLVSVLESVRCPQFQYNVFDWHKDATDLGDYLTDFNLSKSWESDTEYASEASDKNDEDNLPTAEPSYSSGKMDVDSYNSSAKRKNVSDDMKDSLTPDIKANVEVRNESFLCKRIKVDQDKNAEINEQDIFNEHTKPVQNFGPALGMEDAIENVIRMTLENNRRKSTVSSDKSHITSPFESSSLNQTNDVTENKVLSSASKHASEDHVYPHSLASYVKKMNFNPNFKVHEHTHAKPDVQNSSKYPYFNANISAPSQVLTSSQDSRESVISPVNSHKNFDTEKSRRQMIQNKFPVKNLSVTTYNKTSDASLPSVDIGKKLSVYQDGQNLISKSATFEQTRKVPNITNNNSQPISDLNALHRLNVSKPQFLSNSPIASSSSVTSSRDLCPSKETVVMCSSSHSPIADVSKSSSMFKAKSKYQVIDNDNDVKKANIKRIDQSTTNFLENQLIHCDRSSVIQHTMQHLSDLSQNQINDPENHHQLPVSVNTNTAEQIRSVLQKEISNLPPFTVNVADKTILNSNLALSANFVIARKPQPQIQTSSPESVSSNLTAVRNTDTICIPGILASPSVIVSPWETQRKVHGELKYKKKTNTVNASAVDKRIYKNRGIPYGKPIFFKPEPKRSLTQPDSKVVEHKSTSDKNNNTHEFKAVAAPSHIKTNFVRHPPVNQNSGSSSQNLTVLNKSSAQGVSQPNSSQPWYSEPFPKTYRNNISSKLNESLNFTVEQSTSSAGKTMQPFQQVSERKMYTYSKQQAQSSNNHPLLIPSAVSTVSSLINNPVPSTKSSVLNSSTISSVASTSAMLNKSISQNVHIPASSSAGFQSSNVINLKTYSAKTPVSSVESSQLSTNQVQDKNYIAYKVPVPNITVSHPLYSQVSSNDLSNTCCSPSEVNPCQNCSLPSDNMIVSSSSRSSSEGHHGQINQNRQKMIPGKDLPSTASFNSNISSNENSADNLGLTYRNLVHCQYCSIPILENRLQMHMLNCSQNFSIKNNLIPEISPNLIASENFCVPEQNSFFQKESFQNDLPHTKSFLDNIENPQSATEVDKNLEEIDANAFSACMDLISNDKDLERIVQGFDSLEQMDNSYLPFIPSDSTGMFLNSDLCNEIKKNFIGETQLQNSATSEKIDIFNNYTVDCEQLQFQENQLDVEKSCNPVFEFSEKDYESSRSVQNFVNSRPQASNTDKIAVNASKSSDELSFSAVAESCKVSSIAESLDSKLNTVGNCVKINQNEIPRAITSNINNEALLFSCPLCTKRVCSLYSLKRHINNIHADDPRKTSLLKGSASDFQKSEELHENVHDNDGCQLSPILHDLSTPLQKVEEHHPNVFASDHESESPKLMDLTVPAHNSVVKLESGVNSESRNSYHDHSDSPNNASTSNVNKNSAISNASEIGGVLPKGRIKGIIKSPTLPCKFCGKMLTILYMKKHIQIKHKEMTIPKTENSPSDINLNVNLNSCNVNINLNSHDVNMDKCLSSDGLNSDINLNSRDIDIDMNLGTRDDNIGLNFSSCDLNSALNSHDVNPDINLNPHDLNTGINLSLHDVNNDISLNSYNVNMAIKSSSHNVNADINFSSADVNRDISMSPQVNSDINLISESQVGSINFPSVSPLREQDIDSSTCLSVSDALKRNGSYTVTETSNVSESKEKIIENSNIRFDFNVLEIAKETKLANKLPVSEENESQKFVELPSKNINLEGKNVQSKVPHVKQEKQNEQKHPCSVCHKYYSSVAVLNRHLRGVHKITTVRTPRQNKVVDQSKKNILKINENVPIPLNASHNATKSYVEVSDKEKILPFAKEASSSQKNSEKTSKIRTKITAEKTPRQNKMLDQSKKDDIKINENMLIHPDVSHCSKNSNVEVSNNEKILPFTREELSSQKNSEKAFKIRTNIQAFREKHKNLLFAPNLKNSLLKKVLQTNFVSRQVENQKPDETVFPDKETTIQNEHLNVYDASDILENNQMMFNTEMIKTDESQSNIYTKSSAEILCDSNMLSESQPFKDVSKTEIPESLNKYSYDLLSGTTLCSDLSLPQSLGITHLDNELHRTIENSEMKYPTSDNLKIKYSTSQNSEVKFSDMTNSQNLSIQSSEISPISEIISNVSKCHFGGTSNNDHEKEMYEDNSLKLMIPDNPDESKRKENVNKNVYDMRPKQESLQIKENYANTIDVPKILPEEQSEFSVISTYNSEKESSELESISDNLNENCVRCRICHQNLESMEILSRHLKEIHDIPVLKKCISQPCFTDQLAYSKKIEKLSPPKLKFGPNEYDSDSVSEFDNPEIWCKQVNSADLNSSEKPRLSSESSASERILCESTEINSANLMCNQSELKLLNATSELELSEGVLYDSSISELSKDEFHDTSEMELSKGVLRDAAQSDLPKDVLHDTAELELSKDALHDTAESELSKDVLNDATQSDLPKDVLHDAAESDLPKDVLYVAAESEVLHDAAELDPPKELDSSEFDPSKELDSSEFDTSKEFDASEEEMYDSAESNLSKDLLCNSTKLDACKKLLCDSSKLGASKEFLGDSSEIDSSKEVLDDKSELCQSNDIQYSPSEVHSFKEMLCNSNACQDINCDSSELNSSKKLLSDSIEEDSSKKLLEYSSELCNDTHNGSEVDTSKNSVYNISELDACKNCSYDSSKVEIPEEAFCENNLNKKACKQVEDINFNNLRLKLNKQFQQKNSKDFKTLQSKLRKKLNHKHSKELKNSQSKCKNQLRNTNSTEHHSDSLPFQLLNPLLSFSELRPKSFTSSLSKNQFRRHSFSSLSSIFHYKDLSFDMKNSVCNNSKRSISLPNLKVPFHILTSKTECQKISSKSPSRNHTHSAISSEEHTLYSNVTESTEICKSSCNSSSSSSSSSLCESPSVQWDETNSSSFVLPNPLLNPPKRRGRPPGRRKTILRSKFSGRKLIIQRLRTYEKQKKSKKIAKVKSLPDHKSLQAKENYTTSLENTNILPKNPSEFKHKIIKAKKTYDPTIVNLKVTKISEIHKTFKQPVVKLIRLEENDKLLRKKKNSVRKSIAPHPKKICNKYRMKEAVVKLERLQIPVDIIDSKLLVPNLLSQHNFNFVTLQSHQNENMNCAKNVFQTSNKTDVFPDVSILPGPLKDTEFSSVECFDFDSSSDSVQIIETDIDEGNEFCSTPSTKKCQVVLNRILV